jgi:hypothetical protein
MPLVDAVEGLPMSPPREEKTTDARMLQFPVATVVQIVITVLSIAGAVYGMTARLDVIDARMEAQATIAAKDAAADKERYDRLQSDLAALQREDRLRSYDIKAIEARLVALEPKGRRQ